MPGPYKKPNSELQSINVFSNHPPQILTQLANSINNRLSRNSKHQHEDDFNKSGNKTNLLFNNLSPPTTNKKLNIKGQKIWFNPQYNQNVLINITEVFLKLIDNYFPPFYRLHKIFSHFTITLAKAAWIIFSN